MAAESIAGMRRRTTSSYGHCSTSAGQNFEESRGKGIRWWDDPQHQTTRFTAARSATRCCRCSSLKRSAPASRPSRRTTAPAPTWRRSTGWRPSRARSAPTRCGAAELTARRPAPADTERGPRDTGSFLHAAALVNLAAGEVTGQVQVPGHVTAVRERGRLRFAAHYLLDRSAIDRPSEDDLVNVLHRETRMTGSGSASWRGHRPQSTAGQDLLMVRVLTARRGRGVAEPRRPFTRHLEMDWVAISSYGSAPSPAAWSGSSRT